MKEPIFKWDADTKTAYCAIWDADGNMHEGKAFCHEDDFDMANEKTGLEIARRRAEISAYKAYRYRLKIELEALNHLASVINHSSKFNPKSYENIMLNKQIKLREEDLATVKEIITEERIKLKIYITEKDALYKQLRALRAKRNKAE